MRRALEYRRSLPGRDVLDFFAPIAQLTIYIISITSEDDFAGLFRSEEAQLRWGE